MNKISVMIIEDNSFLRNGIEILLNNEPDIKVIKAASDFDNTSFSDFELKNMLILLDMSLHNQDSLLVTEKLHREKSGTVIIVMDIFPQKEEIEEFIKAGASGFINKDATIKEFLSTIRTVADDEKVLPNHLPGSLFSRIAEHAAQSKKVRPNDKAVKITKQERKIIELIGEGLSNEEITDTLKISPGKVQRYKDSVMNKLALREVLLRENQ